MPSSVLVVVGHCSSTTARILVVARPEGPLTWATISYDDGTGSKTQTIKLKHAEPFVSGVIELEGLARCVRVRYRIGIGRSKKESIPVDGEENQFKLLPARPPRTALVSCNGPEDVSPPRDYEMWRRLKEAVDQEDVDLIVHAGDQIYADKVRQEWNTSGKTIGLANAPQAATAELTARYREMYWASWMVPEVRSVLASCPSVMMWDDHEIFDGWGSHGDEDQPANQAFLRAAAQAFSEFQSSHGPPRIDQMNSFAAAFDHEGVGFLLLDARGPRSWKDGTIVGEHQWRSVDAWLASIRDKALRRLYVVVGTPPVHLRVALVEWLIAHTGLRRSDLDDLRDTWTASRNRGEANRLLLRLFNFMAETNCEVTILGGDVHVASLAKIESRFPAHRRDGYPRRVYQVTSSAIGRLPPGDFLVSLLRLAQGRVDLSFTDDVTGELIALAGGRGTSNFLGERNFAILGLDDGAYGWDRHGNLKVRFVAETSGNVDSTLYRT